MNSFLHIIGISRPDFLKIHDELCRLFPELTGNPEAFLETDGRCSILLSSKTDWYDNRDEVFDKIKRLSPALFTVSGTATRLELAMPIDIREFRHRNLTSFIIVSKFSKKLVDLGIKLSVSIKTDNDDLDNTPTHDSHS